MKYFWQDRPRWNKFYWNDWGNQILGTVFFGSVALLLLVVWVVV